MGINIKNIEQANTSRAQESQKRGSTRKSDSLSLFSKKFNDKKRESFFSELGILLNSGLDLSAALRLVIEQENGKDEKLIYSGIYDSLLKGTNLSDSIRNSKRFTDYDYYSIKMGEESGYLGEVLTELSQYYGKKIKYRRKIISVMSYPVLVLISAVGALVFMLNFLVPAFADIFSRTNNELPSITKFIISLSKSFSTGLTVFAVLVLIMGVTYYYNREKDWLKNIVSRIMLKIPLFGPIIRLFYLERFFISMVLLTRSRVPLVTAINLSKLMIKFYPFEVALAKIETDIVKGKLLSESMKEFAIFDKKIITLVKVGEEVNQLGAIFDKLSQQYSADLDHRFNNIAALLEPVLILFVGLIVAVILIAMYLPIFQMGNYIQ